MGVYLKLFAGTTIASYYVINACRSTTVIFSRGSGYRAEVAGMLSSLSGSLCCRLHQKQLASSRIVAVQCMGIVALMKTFAAQLLALFSDHLLPRKSTNTCTPAVLFLGPKSLRNEAVLVQSRYVVFSRAMLRRAQYCYCKLSVRPSVSVTLRYHGHIG